MSLAPAVVSVEESLAAARATLFAPVRCEAVGTAQSEVEAIAPGAPLVVAASRMWWRDRGALLVTEDGRMVGALSEDDLMHALADRVRERAELVAEAGDDLVVWEQLLDGLAVRDAMTEAADAAVVRAGASLLQGIEATFGPTSRRRRKSYVFVVDEKQVPMRVVSFRDIARFLVQVYDGEIDRSLFGDASAFGAAQSLAWRLLDLSLGWLRENEQLGSRPDPLAGGADATETITRLATHARGYALVTARDGALRGICTRHDVLRALKSPYVRLEMLRAARLTTEPVKTVSAVDTLCGLFKMMAIEGFRHMPLVDAWDRVQCVISMWQGVGLLAHRPGEGH